MVLPLLAGTAIRSLATTSAKKVAANKFLPSKKARTKSQYEKTGGKPGGLVKYQKDAITTDDSKVDYKKFVDDTSKKTTKKRTVSKNKKIDDILDQMISTLKSIDTSLKKGLKTEKTVGRKSRTLFQISKKRKREEELETKKEKGGIIGRVGGSISKSGPFAAIMRFLSSVLVGGIVMSIIENGDKIAAAMTDIENGLKTTFGGLRIGIISFSRAFKKPISSVLKAGGFIFRQFKRLASGFGRMFSAVLGGFKKLFVEKLGKYTPEAIKSGITKMDDLAKATPSALKKLNPTRAFKSGALRLFGKNGLKHLTKVSNAFKRIPFVGALIGIGIDLAMGERIDNAIVGAVGASLGAAIGGAIGQGLIPIPIVGAGVGAFVGAGIGDWAGKSIYKHLTGQVKTEIEFPPEYQDRVMVSGDNAAYDNYFPGAPGPLIRDPGRRSTGSGTGSAALENETDEEYRVAAAIYTEGGLGKSATDILQVAANRVASANYPNNFTSVFAAPGQFAGVEKRNSAKFREIRTIEDAARWAGTTPATIRQYIAAIRSKSNRADSASFVGGALEFRAAPAYYQKYGLVPGQMNRQGRFYDSKWRGTSSDNQFLVGPKDPQIKSAAPILDSKLQPGSTTPKKTTNKLLIGAGHVDTPGQYGSGQGTVDPRTNVRESEATQHLVRLLKKKVDADPRLSKVIGFIQTPGGLGFDDYNFTQRTRQLESQGNQVLELHFDQHGGGRPGIIARSGQRTEIDKALARRFGDFGPNFKQGKLGVPDAGGTILELMAIDKNRKLLDEIRRGQYGPESEKLVNELLEIIEEGLTKEGKLSQLQSSRLKPVPGEDPLIDKNMDVTVPIPIMNQPQTNQIAQAPTPVFFPILGTGYSDLTSQLNSYAG